MKRLVLLALLTLACSENPAYDRILSDLKSGSISFDDGLRVLLHGDVVGLSQDHSRHIEIRLRDGRTFQTRQPVIDIAVRILRARGIRDQVDYTTE